MFRPFARAFFSGAPCESLCTALWKSKGARAAKTLTVEPSAANGGDDAVGHAGTIAAAEACKECGGTGT